MTSFIPRSAFIVLRQTSELKRLSIAPQQHASPRRK